MKFGGLILAILMLTLCSCSEESISPAFNPVSFSEQRSHRPFTVSFDVDEIQIDQFGRELSDVDVIGGVLGDVVRTIADFKLDEDGGTMIPIEPSIIEVPSMSEEDIEAVEQLILDKVELGVMTRGEKAKEEESLKFIKRVEIYVTLDPEVISQIESNVLAGTEIVEASEKIADEAAKAETKTETKAETKAEAEKESEEKFDPFKGATLVMGYRKGENFGSLKHNGATLVMDGVDIPWKKLIVGKNKVAILTRLVVESVPRTDMKVKAKIFIKAKLDSRI